MRSATVFVFMAFLVWPAMAVAQEDAFVVAAETRYLLPPDGGDLPIWIAAGAADMEAVRLDILYLRDPAGHVFHDGVTLTDEDTAVATLDGAGKVVTLRLKGARFSASGDYSLALRLSGQPKGGNTRVHRVVTVTLVRQATALAVDGLPSGFVRLYRGWPLGAATYRQPLLLRATGGAIGEMTMQVEVSSGSGDDRRSFTGVTAELLPADVQLAPGKAQSAALKLGGVDEIGSHQVSLTLTSANLTAPVTSSFKIIVTDHPIWALLVVFLGVAVSFYLRYLVDEVNPGIDIQLELTAIGENLDRLLKKNPSHDGLLALKDKVNRLAIDLETGKREQVEEAVEAARGELNETRKKLKERRQTIRGDLAATRQSISRFQESIPSIGTKEMVAEDEMFFAAADGLIQSVSRALDEMRTEEAVRVYENLVQEFNERMRFHLGRNLRLFKDVIEAKTGDNADKLIQEIQSMRDKVHDEQPDLFQLWQDHALLGAKCDDLRSANRMKRTPSAQRLVLGFAAAADEPTTDAEPAGEEPAEPGVAEQFDHQAQRQVLLGEQRRNQILISLVALILASAIGFTSLYDGTSAFGTFGDYATALAWGFGFDNGVRGVGSVLTRLRGGGG